MQLRIEKKHHTVVWNVNAECRRVIKPIAAEFGMKVEEFLTGFSNRSLPAQPIPRDSKKEYEFNKGTEVKFACSDPALTSRIARAAAFSESSLPAYVMESIIGMVECAEDDMIISPKTGEPIADDFDIMRFCTYESYQEVAA